MADTASSPPRTTATPETSRVELGLPSGNVRTNIERRLRTLQMVGMCVSAGRKTGVQRQKGVDTDVYHLFGERNTENSEEPPRAVSRLSVD